jgi:hypothetical protein
MIHGTCTTAGCEHHGRHIEVDMPKSGAVPQSAIAAAPGQRMDAQYHLARQAGCPACAQPLAALVDIKMTVPVSGRTDQELQQSARAAVRAGRYAITGVPAANSGT